MSDIFVGCEASNRDRQYLSIQVEICQSELNAKGEEFQGEESRRILTAIGEAVDNFIDKNVKRDQDLYAKTRG